MYLPVDKETFVNRMIALFPDKFTRTGLGILFEYLERREAQFGEEELDEHQIQLTYAESTYNRFISFENRFEDPIGEGKSLSSNISVCGRSLKELQQNVKKHIEALNATLIGFTSDKTVVYTRD